MKKKTSGPMVNERREVVKVAVVQRGWQARRVGKTQPAMRQLIHSRVKMDQLIHLPKEKQLTLPQETTRQLIQSPLKVHHLIHPPMKMEQLTLPQKTRPN